MKHINDHVFAVCVISLSVVYQVACAIQGFDLTDEGHLMILYRYFGEDPQVSQCASGYPLTCYLGWLLHSLYPAGGILMMRLWGVLLVTVAEVVCYLYLQQYFGSKRFLLLGLLIQTVFVAGDPKPFGYNTLSGLFAILVVICINEGCRRKRWWLLLLGGTVMGVSPFLRIPNISFLAFLIVPFCYWYFNRQTVKFTTPVCQAGIVCIGFLIGLAATWEWMCAIGADGLIRDFIHSLGGQLSGNSSHNSGSMMSRYMLNYTKALLHFILFFSCITSLSAVWCRNRWATGAAVISAFLILHWFTYNTTGLLGDNILYLLNSIGIFGAVYYAIHYKRGMTEAALAAAVASVILPLGSDLGFLTMWTGTTLSFPIGLCAINEWATSVDSSKYYLTLVKIERESAPRQITRTKTLKLVYVQKALLVCTLILLADTVTKIDKKAYYDPGTRFSKTHPINSPWAKGIYTHAYKAKAVNETLAAMSRYVQPGDVILVYDFSPLLYYLTDTKPWAGIAWPCVYFGQPYVDKFNATLKTADQLPVVVMQHFYSSNRWQLVLNANRHTNNYLRKKSLDNKDEALMNQCVLHFLKEHHYKSVWTNGLYEILSPEHETLQDKQASAAKGGQML